MKHLFHLLLAGIFSNSVSAQFVKFYGDVSSGHDLHLSADGNMLALFSTKLCKLNLTGDVIWESEELESWSSYDIHNPEKIYELPGGDIVVFTSEEMRRYTSEGDLVLAITHGYELISNIYQVSDGFHIIGAFDYPYYGHVYYFKLYNDGTTAWTNEIPMGAFNTPSVFLFDGEKATHIFSDPMPDPPYLTLHYVYDTTGALLFEDSSEFSFHNQVIDEDNTIYTGASGGEEYTYKFNSEWILEWDLITDVHYGAYDSLVNMIRLHSGTILKTIHVSDPDISGNYIEYISPEGDSMGRSNIFLSGGYSVNDVIQVDTNLLAMTGVCFGPVTQAFIFFTDTLGSILQLTTTGRVYYDENENDLYDEDELAFKNIINKTDPVPFYGVSDGDGIYTSIIYNPDATSQTVILPAYWDIVEPLSHSFELTPETSGDTLYDLDYRLSYSTPVTDANLSLCASWIYIDGPVTATVTINNFGNQTIASGSVSLRYPAALSFISTTPEFADHIDTVITWNYSDLDPFETISFQCKLFTPADIELVGTTAYLSAELSMVEGDISPENNMDSMSQTIDYSLDPNHKTATPPEGVTDIDIEWMEYVIDFQNTGTAPAIDITIEDSIDIDLVFTGIQMLGSSHNYSMEMTAPNLVKWHFKNIYLPDSSSDLPGSMGFVNFRIPIVAGLPEGSEITNTARIYFDLNEPVITNTTVNTLYDIQTSIEEEQIITGITIYPNPASETVIFEFDAYAEEELQIDLFDSMGKKVLSETKPAADQSVVVMIKSLPAGIYIARCTHIISGISQSVELIKY